MRRAADRRERGTERAWSPAFSLSAPRLLAVVGRARVRDRARHGVAGRRSASSCCRSSSRWARAGRARCSSCCCRCCSCCPPARPALVASAHVLARATQRARTPPCAGSSSHVADRGSAIGRRWCWRGRSSVRASGRARRRRPRRSPRSSGSTSRSPSSGCTSALGIEVRAELASFGWVYLVDVLLTPVGLLAAAVGPGVRVAVAAVLPLAALLSVFARERRGPDRERARAAPDGRGERGSPASRSSRTRATSSRSSSPTARSARSRARPSRSSAPTGTRRSARPSREWAHPDDAPLRRALLAPWRAGRARSPRTRPSGGSAAPTAPTATWRRSPRTSSTTSASDGIVLTARDVDERRAFEEQLRHRAFHDPLTQLANRALFYDRIEHALSRERPRRPDVAVLFLDLDDFKVVNDEHGPRRRRRAAGRASPARLRGCLRSADTAARLGGDEFGVLLETSRARTRSSRSPSASCRRSSEPFVVHGERSTVSAEHRHGASPAPAERSVDELLRRADLAMYAAKRDGKRRWEFYDGDSSGSPSRPRRGARARARGSSAAPSSARRSSACSDATAPSAWSSSRSSTCAPAASPATRRSRASTAPGEPAAERVVRPGAPLRPRLRARGARVAAALAAPGRPRGHLPDRQPQPVRADLGARPGRAARVARRTSSSSSPRTSCSATRPASTWRWPTCASAAAASPSTTPAPATPASSTSCGSAPTSSSSTARSSPASKHDDGRAALIASFVRLRPRERRRRLRRGHRDPRRPRATGRPRRHVRAGLRHRTTRREPWGAAAQDAVDACTVSFTTALTLPRGNDLEHVVSLLAAARNHAELAAAAEPIARELRADHVVLDTDPFGTREVIQVLTGDPAAAPAERERWPPPAIAPSCECP